MNIDPNLQRLRDVSGQLFLTDQQVEQLVNYVQMYMRGVGLSLSERNNYGDLLRKTYGTIVQVEPVAGIAVKENVMVSGLFDGFIFLGGGRLPEKSGSVSFLFCSQPIGFIEGDEEGNNRFFSLPSLVGVYSGIEENKVINTFWPKVDDNSPIICKGGSAQIVLPPEMRDAYDDFAVYVTFVGVRVWFA